MTDSYQGGGGGQSCVAGLHDQELGNSRNSRRRRSEYDDYSEGCYDEDDQDEDDNEHDGSCCQCMRCPAQIFTSVLLGLLACVLVTGGVFLAFHKWDHTWLLVSAIGVILMAIGTAMHCCSSQANRKPAGVHRCKGGCTSNVNGVNRSHHPIHKGGEIISNGNVLTEQLLPLSNARSVSQLSLNMVPGYFPPLVYSASGAPYGLEQHSAVVQNISRLVQHQTQLHLQQPGTTTQPSTDGAKSFILVPLSTQAPHAASIQNIVAAVCQLDATNGADNGRDVQMVDTSQATRSSFVLVENYGNNPATTVVPQQAVAPSISSANPSHKNAEVQTCNNWNITNQVPNKVKPMTSTTNIAIVTGSCSDTFDCSSNATAEFSCQTLETAISSWTTQSPEMNEFISREESTPEVPHEQYQTDELPLEETVSVPSVEISCNSSNCDNLPVIEYIQNPTVNETTSVVTDILLDGCSVTASDMSGTNSNEVLQHQTISLSAIHSFEEVDSPSAFDPTPASLEVEDAEGQLINHTVDSNITDIVPNSSGRADENVISMISEEIFPGTSGLAESANSTMGDAVLSSDSSDFDDSEFLDRSSPPPSYEDVAHAASPSGGAFGTSYGTM